ncbi:hypothetical protein CGCFRS4_v001219 [Colletotrichum fructicola]|nr:hypothetical protein CGCFRS4_v001219 [Colletotrichum fructicola]
MITPRPLGSYDGVAPVYSLERCGRIREAACACVGRWEHVEVHVFLSTPTLPPPPPRTYLSRASQSTYTHSLTHSQAIQFRPARP